MTTDRPKAARALPSERRAGWTLAGAAVLVSLLGGVAAPAGAAEPPAGSSPAPPPRAVPDRLAFLVGAGYVGSPGLHGADVTFGLRYRPLAHLALSLDLGYGVEGGDSGVQDRWWIMPSVALVVPVGAATLDLGAGLGLGASSGYRSLPAYVAAPFDPIWAYQLVPTVRLHAMISLPVGRRVDLFLRVDAATLLLDGNSFGSRVGDPHPGLADTIWYGLAVGARFRLL